MANFFVELWDSVFTPGTSPALIRATHGSFVLLVVSLVWMVFTSRSIHFFNLLIIALCLWASVTWFVAELAKAKADLKTNEQLAKEGAAAGTSSDGPERGEEKETEKEEKKEK